MRETKPVKVLEADEDLQQLARNELESRRGSTTEEVPEQTWKRQDVRSNNGQYSRVGRG